MGQIIEKKVGDNLIVLVDSQNGRTVSFRRVPSKNPIQKKQWVKAIVTLKPATFTEKSVVKEELFFLPFMEAVVLAQKRWPKKTISYTTLQVEAAKKPKPLPAPAEKVE